MVKIEVKELTDRKLKLVVKETTSLFLNTVRRTLMAEVPKMAIEEVDFHLGPLGSEDDADVEFESMTPLFDEIIAHRLGMVPIPTDLGLLKFRDECPGCEGKGCPSCTITYIINKKGKKEGEIVYSGDLEPVGGDSAFRAADKLIPIVKLGEGEALLVYATAILGRGRDNVKWQPVTAPYFFPVGEVKIDPAKCDGTGACMEKCPKKVFQRGKDGRMIVAEVDNCNLCNACIDICELDAVKVTPVEGAFRFGFETDGALTTKSALKAGLHIVQEKFDSFITELKKLK